MDPNAERTVKEMFEYSSNLFLDFTKLYSSANFNSSQNKAGNLRRCGCAPQWSRGGDDGSAGAVRAAGCRRGRRQLAGLPGGHHPAPLLQPLVQPRCSGCWIRHDRYELPSRTQRGSRTNVRMHILYRH